MDDTFMLFQFAAEVWSNLKTEFGVHPNLQSFISPDNAPSVVVWCSCHHFCTLQSHFDILGRLETMYLWAKDDACRAMEQIKPYVDMIMQQFFKSKDLNQVCAVYF
jgi:hypothetical protein